MEITLILGNSKTTCIIKIGQLQSIGGDADFNDSQVTDMGQLTSIGGYTDFEGSKITQKQIDRIKIGK